MGRGKWILLQCRVLPFVIIFGALLVLAIAGGRRSRARAVARIRAGWGQPVIASERWTRSPQSHRSRLSNIGTGAGSGRSDLGGPGPRRGLRGARPDREHARPARALSSAADRAGRRHLDAFDALVNRLGADAELRERAQIALARLQDPHGYDLWWLARRDAIDVTAVVRVFPIADGRDAGAARSSHCRSCRRHVPRFIAIFLLNVGVRYLTDCRFGARRARFDRSRPVVDVTAESLRFLEGDDVRRWSAPSEPTRRRFGRLKTTRPVGQRQPVHAAVGAGPPALLGQRCRDRRSTST